MKGDEIERKNYTEKLWWFGFTNRKNYPIWEREGW